MRKIEDHLDLECIQFVALSVRTQRGVAEHFELGTIIKPVILKRHSFLPTRFRVNWKHFSILLYILSEN